MPVSIPLHSAPRPAPRAARSPGDAQHPTPPVTLTVTLTLTMALTCLEDLIAQREACPLPGVVGGELDVEHRAGGDDGGGGDVPTVLSQEVCGFTVPIPDLDEVVPT